jgi:thiamine kinase-like enzyme
MGKRKEIRIVETDLQEHPAYQAWSELHPKSAKPERIEILKGKTPRHNQKFKRIVCRLVGVGFGGASVIGKRCRPSNAETENTIYKEILPDLPIPFLNYYGMVKETMGEYYWLFIENAGEEAYFDTLDEHRLLSAQWLARLHTSAIQSENQPHLPRKGTKHYLELLQVNRESILNNISIHRIQDEDLEPFEAVLTNFDFLEEHWDQVEELCRGLPRTLVHGDFVPKNLRILNTNDKMKFVPFDWGEAGWGSPATDIMHVDEGAYWSNVRGSWSWLSLEDIKRSTKVGYIFCNIDSISWELVGFEHKFFRKIISNMRIYESRLAEAIKVAIATD